MEVWYRKKTNFEAWINSLEFLNLMLPKQGGFSLHHFFPSRNVGKDILPNATNRDVTMLLERDGSREVREVRENSEVIWQLLHFSVINHLSILFYTYT